jgi:hypothetical protein
VIAIGETGLDYYWHKDAPEWQRERFRTHLRAARQAQKPLVVHTREAAADTLRLMEEEGAGDAGGVMHCFTETWAVAEAALDRGLLHFAIRYRHVQESAHGEGGGTARAARPPVGGNRFTLSRPGALSWKGPTSRAMSSTSRKKWQACVV